LDILGHGNHHNSNEGQASVIIIHAEYNTTLFDYLSCHSAKESLDSTLEYYYEVPDSPLSFVPYRDIGGGPETTVILPVPAAGGITTTGTLELPGPLTPS
jgi:hypothetical protein